MFRNFAYAAIATLGLAAGAGTADAQFKVNIGIGAPIVAASPVVPVTPIQAAPFHAHKHYHVQYRQLVWKERIFDSPFEARHFADFKDSEGFETILVRHGYHWHVRYRLLGWRTFRTVSSHAYAHELERLLEFRGFDARVIHH